MIGLNDFMSIYGLYQYDPTLFDDMVLPSGVDKDTLVGNLITSLAELEVLYADGDFMKKMIAVWSRKQLPGWERVQRVMTMDYNPIWNKDGVVTETIKNTGTNTMTHGQTIENQTAAYNDAASNNYHNHDKTAMGGKDVTGLESVTVDTREEHGNIGTTSTQSMVIAETQVADIRLMDIIIDEFKRRFCICIY